MNNNIKTSLNGLELGALAIVDLSVVPQAEKSPLHNPLLLSHKDGKAVMRYRQAQSLLVREGAYETELGAVLAASAIVFSAPVTSTPAQMTVLLLMQLDTSRAAADDGLRLMLVQPARDGSYETARPANAAQQQALLQTTTPIDMTPIVANDADMLEIIRAALHQGAHADIVLPISTEDLLEVEFTIPRQLVFDEDGTVYLRDVMSGEADFLFTGQDKFLDAEVTLSLTGGQFYLLQDDQETLEQDRSPDDGVTYISVQIRDFEGLFSRLVIVVDDDVRQAEVEINVSSGDQLIAATSIDIVEQAETIETHYIDVDDTIGLPEEEIFSETIGFDAESEFELEGLYTAPDVL